MCPTSDLNATITSGAADALRVVGQAAEVIDAEWRRVSTAVASSESAPDQLKQVVAQLDDTAEAVRREAAVAAERLPGELADGVEEIVALFGRLSGGCVAGARDATPSTVEVVEVEGDAEVTGPGKAGKGIKAKKAKAEKAKGNKAKKAKAEKGKAKAEKGKAKAENGKAKKGKAKAEKGKAKAENGKGKKGKGKKSKASS